MATQQKRKAKPAPVPEPEVERRIPVSGPAYYAPGPVNYHSTEYRLRQLERMLEHEEQQQELKQAFKSGIEKGKEDSFWLYFGMGMLYGIFAVWAWNKKPGDAAKMFVK